MNDLDLVQRCARAEPQAWREFFEQYSSLIYNRIKSTLMNRGGFFSQAEALDLSQELFLHLRSDNFKKLKSFKAKNGSSLASWLKVVATNFTLSYLRTRPYTISLNEEDADGLELQDRIPDSSVKVREALAGAEEVSGLRECIKGLEKSDRYFLELYLNRHFALERIARALAISRAAVDMRKARILDRLRICFKKKGFMLDY